MFEYIPYQICLSKLKEADQELQRGYMNVFLMRYVLDAETDQEHGTKEDGRIYPFLSIS